MTTTEASDVTEVCRNAIDLAANAIEQLVLIYPLEHLSLSLTTEMNLEAAIKSLISVRRQLNLVVLREASL